MSLGGNGELLGLLVLCSVIVVSPLCLPISTASIHVNTHKLTITAPNGYMKPVYVLNLDIKGFNRTGDNTFVLQMEFNGRALIFVRPVNSSFTEVDVRLVGTVSSGIDVDTMSEGWMEICNGSFPNGMDCKILRVKLNTTDFTKFAERKVNITLRYLVMNKYNYAWEMGSGRFIGFFPFYSVPDVKMYTGKEAPRYVYLNRTIMMYGSIINEITGTWGSMPSSFTLKDASGRNVSLTAITFCGSNFSFIEVDVIHHYVVSVDGAFVLPSKTLGGVFVGTYPYVLIEGTLDPHYVDFVKSIDDYPQGVSVITWGYVERIVAVGVGFTACGVLAAYLFIRRRRRVRG